MATPPGTELDGYEREARTIGGRTREVYRTGRGPAVVVISEIPGITPSVAALGRRVAAIGCTAVLPSLFGTPGRAPSAGYTMRTFAGVCISREFSLLAIGRTSPVVSWLRELATAEHSRCGGPGVGAVGMCLTGGFALAMMVDDRVRAPVLSQPSLPLPLGRARRRDLGLSPADLERVVARAEEGRCVLGLRFSGDRASPPERFEHLREVLGDHFVAIELDSSPGNPHGHPRQAHSVLTEHLQDRPGSPTRQALDRVLDLFRQELLGADGAGGPGSGGEETPTP